MLEIKESFSNSKTTPKVMVIGIGGGGNNAITRMIEKASEYVTYAALNTDSMTLDKCPATKRLQLGSKLTQGFGAGGDPTVGESAAKESEEEITELVRDANMVILTCGMGGGTGTGAIPIVAQICKNLGILTVAVVTMPFSFESKPRVYAAQTGLKKLEQNIDTLLVIPNDKLLTITDKQFFLDDAFTLCDSVLRYTIEGITNIIFNHGTINLDFNDLRSTLKDKGYGLFGIGIATGEETIVEAVEKAISSPLLDTRITGASNILLNTSGKVDLVALNKAVSYIREQAGDNVNIFWGTVSGETTSEDIVVTVIATGMKQDSSIPEASAVDAKEATPKMPAPKDPSPQINSNLDFLKNVKQASDIPTISSFQAKAKREPIQLQIPEFLLHKPV
jgi:cell division protein FtsZ